MKQLFVFLLGLLVGYLLLKIRCKVHRHCNLFILPALQWQHEFGFRGVDQWPSTLILWWGYWGLGFYWQRNEANPEQKT